MKKSILYFTFLSLMLSALFTNAQEIKETTTVTKIMNGDTVINGVNLKEVSGKEKVELKSKLKEASRINLSSPRINKRITVIKDGDRFRIDSSRTTNLNFDSDVKFLTMDKDSLRSDIRIFLQGDSISTLYLGKNGNGEIDWKMVHPRFYKVDSLRKKGFFDDKSKGMDWKIEHPQNNVIISSPSPLNRSKYTNTFSLSEIKNSQNFNFSNTDQNGYTTKINMMVLDANKENLKKVFKNENLETNSLVVENLAFYPNFDTGKINLTFKASVKNINIRLLSNEGETLFSDKSPISTSNYSKPIEMFRNGIYYLEIKSDDQTFIKKIIKN
jgi:hypothetical protein